MSAVLKTLHSILGGCGAEPIILEASTILHRVAESLASGEIDENEALNYVLKVAQTVNAWAQHCGKSYDYNQIVDMLMNAVKLEANKRALESLRSSLKSLKEKKKEMMFREGPF